MPLCDAVAYVGRCVLESGPTGEFYSKTALVDESVEMEATRVCLTLR